MVCCHRNAPLSSENRKRNGVEMPKLKKIEAERLAKQVVHFYDGAGNHDKSVTIRHFKQQGVSKTTIRQIVDRYVNEGRITHKKVGRLGGKKWTPKVVAKVSKKFEKNPNISVREAARQLEMPSSSVSRIKTKMLGIKAHKKVTAPKYEGDQQQRAKRGCRKIYRKMLLSGDEKVLIMDDETYVPADPADIPGTEYYHCANDSDVPPEKKVKPKGKFVNKKFLVWQAIDESGNVSEPFISTGTINAETYLNECLKKRLLPFIMRHHNLENVVFWPDMATSHYAGVVVEWLMENGINFVHKENNAPNVPQARPVEKYWSACKREYKKRKKPAKSLSSFKRIWRNLSEKVARECGRNLMKNVRQELRGIAYSGVYSVL